MILFMHLFCLFNYVIFEIDVKRVLQIFTHCKTVYVKHHSLEEISWSLNFKMTEYISCNEKFLLWLKNCEKMDFNVFLLSILIVITADQNNLTDTQFSNNLAIFSEKSLWRCHSFNLASWKCTTNRGSGHYNPDGNPNCSPTKQFDHYFCKHWFSMPESLVRCSFWPAENKNRSQNRFLRKYKYKFSSYSCTPLTYMYIHINTYIYINVYLNCSP